MKRGILLNIAGQIFGHVLARERVPDPFASEARWKCWCICGKEFVAGSGNLRYGRTKSCGCLRTKAGRTKLGCKRSGEQL